MFDIICWVLIGASIITLVWVLWSCLVIAGRFDEISKEYWDEYCGKENEDGSEEISEAATENRQDDRQ